MCLVITAAAAVITTLLWYFKFNDKKLKMLILVFMYWGAALMWTIDGFFCVAEGEGFLDLSANDALLGLVIVLCGLILWAVITVISDPKHIVRKMMMSR